ncbi:hypothetical protein PoB_004372300 [Plakobranchus ocellatus]|uniref:HTH psq-type domain-containing protein n=1 Tax=Plakobranchus ocellatus TaxID=259542 RepID=A0AAV4BEE1_9GAST|nr:hypothetical protein PoB_004372300 [Plakobranchus ocellatus]
MTPYKKHTHEAFEKALEAAKNGSMKLMNAAKQFGVPRATLFDKLHNRTPMKPSARTRLTCPGLPRSVVLFCDGHTSHVNPQNGDAPKSQLIVATASETTSKSNGPGPSGDRVFSDKMDAIATSQYIEKDLEPTIHDDVPRLEVCFSDPEPSSEQTSMEDDIPLQDGVT